jgi:prephenate dehydrogenase
MKVAKKKSLGLFGYGAFGRFIAGHLASNFSVRVYDASEQVEPSRAEVAFAPLAEVAACDIVVLAVPVDAMSGLVDQIIPFLKRGALVLDVGSTKILPATLLTEKLPSYVDVICTHPLFGPQSGKHGVAGLKIVVCPIKGRRLRQVSKFLRQLFLEVIVATPDQHDREAALVQGLTHLIAKVLIDMEPLPMHMTTKSFDLMMAAVEMVRYDSASVFKAIERDTPYAKGVREKFFQLAQALSRSF